MDRPTCQDCGTALAAAALGGLCPKCLLAEGRAGATAIELGRDAPELADGEEMSPNLGEIGPYRLVRVLGEGGMGTVYLAEQKVPLRRRVALKLVKAGMDTREVIRRFEAERRSLALMEHHGIARALDAGETDSGRPYFVMELVEGVPLTAYCDARKLGIRERLEIFLEVCEAVEHAHLKGVIHRDLKPSNLLVVEGPAGCPAPKVIDFGIAKAMGEDFGDTLNLTLATGRGQILGTLQYMSPEQAAATPPDTRSDVYALGTVLYELLTGGTPLRRDRLRQAPFDEILRLVCEEDPERPSTRVATLTSTAPSVAPVPPGEEEAAEAAARRGESLERWRRRLSGDLDWIVLKALEKEPVRRYSSVAALAADLRRHLRDEPVEARPPSRGYRLRKFVRRNKVLTLSTCAVAAVLLAATAVSVRWAYEAEEARRVAEARLAQADAVPDFLFNAFRQADPTQGPRDRLAVEVLDRAVEEAGAEFSEQPLMRARIFESLAQTYLRLGFYDKADALIASAEEASRLIAAEDPELRARLLRILSETRRLEHRMAEAAELSEANWRAVRERAEVGSEEELRARNEWILNLIQSKQLDRAEVALEEALADAERFPELGAVDFKGLYGGLRAAQGRHDEAYEWMEARLVETSDCYLASDHDLMWKVRHFAALLFNMGRLQEAAAWSEALVRCAEEVYGVGHHLTTETADIHVQIEASLESPESACFAGVLLKDETLALRRGTSQLLRLEETLAELDPDGSVAASLAPWIESLIEDPGASAEPPPPLGEQPGVWAALSDFQARNGASGSARQSAGRAYELSRERLSPDDPRLAVRAARWIQLLADAGELEQAESVLAAHWEPSLLDPPTGRFLVDACERLVERLDEAGQSQRARLLDRERLLPALEALVSSISTWRYSKSYRRIVQDLGDRGEREERLRFQEAMSDAVQLALPVRDDFRRAMQIRLAEVLLHEGRTEMARERFSELVGQNQEAGSIGELRTRLDLMFLESKLLRAEGNAGGAEALLLDCWSLAEGEQDEHDEAARGAQLRRVAAELRRHHEAGGNEEARREWARRELLATSAVTEGTAPLLSAVEGDDLASALEALEALEAPGNSRDSSAPSASEAAHLARLAGWLSEELEARGEAGPAARAALGALRAQRLTGTGREWELLELMHRIGRGRAESWPEDEVMVEVFKEVEGVFREILGSESRAVWLARLRRLASGYRTLGADETVRLSREYFETFPEEDERDGPLRVWLQNDLARGLLNSGEPEEALAQIEAGWRFSERLVGRAEFPQGEVLGTRRNLASLYIRYYRLTGNFEREEYWLQRRRELDAEAEARN